MSSNIITGTITVAAVDGGDAAELQTRLQDLFLASAGLFLVDVSLAGTGDGPRWLCEVSKTDDSNTGTLTGFAGTPGARVFAVEAGDPGALQFKILQVLTSVGAPFNYVAIRVAGASSGRQYMAVIVVRVLGG